MPAEIGLFTRVRGRPIPTVVRQRPCADKCIGRREGTLGETTLRAEKKSAAALRYDLEMESRNVGWGDPALVYDEEKELFRFRDGRFAFSREHADWELLRKRGRMKRL